MKDSLWMRSALAAACVVIVAGAARSETAGAQSTGSAQVKPAETAKTQDFQQGDKSDSRAVKPCQEEIRKKAKAEHGDVDINFESVETKKISEDVVGVKGKFRLGKGNDSTTMKYTCRVDVKAMKVNRAEYGKEN